MWQSIEEAPLDRPVKLWLGAHEGEDKPLGEIIGVYVDNEYFSGWVERSLSGNINTGLPQNLITHWGELDDGPDSFINSLPGCKITVDI